MINAKKYLEMCKNAAMLVDRSQNGNFIVPDEVKIIYNREVYYPISLDISFDKQGNAIVRAILHSLITNNFVGGDLSDMQLFEGRKSDFLGVD